MTLGERGVLFKRRKPSSLTSRKHPGAEIYFHAVSREIVAGAGTASSALSAPASTFVASLRRRCWK